MRIVTKHTSNANGRPQVIAKGGGKQRTISWDLAKSTDWNHGAAAGTLFRAHFGQVGEPALTDLLSKVRQEVKDADTQVFTF